MLQKLFTATLIVFLILTITTIPNLTKHKTLQVNLEIEDVTHLPTTSIFLLNKDNLLVKTSIFINQQEEIPYIIDCLKRNNKNIPSDLKGYLSKDVKLINYQLEDNILYLDFSKELLTKEKQMNDRIITGIVYSLLEIDGVEKVSITINKEPLKDYPKLLDKSIGVNKDYEINQRKDIKKVVIYYLDGDNNYLPITKYLNDNRDKIEIIIEELKNSDDNISPLNINTELISYKEVENVLYLNFNEYLLDKNEETRKEIIDMISYSVFENYDVNMVMFEVENKEIEYRKK